MSLIDMKNTIKMTCSEVRNTNYNREYTIDYLGNVSGSKMLNIKTHHYWNGKFIIGRYIENIHESQIVFHSSQNQRSFSRKHAEISIKRAFDLYYISYRFLTLLLCLKKQNIYFIEDALKIILRFYHKPRKIIISPEKVLKNYVLVRDLGSQTGTKVRIKKSTLKTDSNYLLADDRLIIEEVSNEGILYESHFFRGISNEYIVVISEEYKGNVEEDSKIPGKCGFPYVKCQLNEFKYILIATGKKFTFLIGRVGECDVYLNKSTISRQHATISYDKNSFSWVISDGNPENRQPSSNGTFKHLLNQGEKSEWELCQENEILINNLKFTFS